MTFGTPVYRMTHPNIANHQIIFENFKATLYITTQHFHHTESQKQFVTTGEVVETFCPLFLSILLSTILPPSSFLAFDQQLISKSFPTTFLSMLTEEIYTQYV